MIFNFLNIQKYLPVLLCVIITAAWAPETAAQTGPGCKESACVRAGPRLASVSSSDGALLNALTTTLLGTDVNLDVVDWNALAQAEINLLDFLRALQTDLGVASTDQVLNTDVDLLQIIDAAIDVSQTDGNTAAVSALQQLRIAIDVLSPLPPIRLGDLLNITTDEGSISDATFNMLELVQGSISLFNYRHVASTPKPVTLQGPDLGMGGILKNVQLFAQVVEPPVISCGPEGTTFYSAAIRTKLNLDLVEIDISNEILGLISVPSSLTDLEATVGQLELYAAVARGQGVISTIDAIQNTIQVDADPGVVDLYMGSMDDAVFFNRNAIINPETDLQRGTIGNINIGLNIFLLGNVDVKVDINAKAYTEGNDQMANLLTFTGPYPEQQTAGNSSTFSTNLVNTLFSTLDVDLDVTAPSVIGPLLEPVLNPLLNSILSVIDGVLENVLTPVLNSILANVVDPLLAPLGVGLGEMDVTASAPRRRCFAELGGFVYEDVNHNAAKESDEDGTGLPLYAKLIDQASPGQADTVVTVDPATGRYSFGLKSSGTYAILVDDNANKTDITAHKPPEWVGTEAADQRIDSIQIRGNTHVGSQDFGLYHGSKLTGLVFRDDGAGGGTANDGAPNGDEPGITESALKLAGSAGNTVYDQAQTPGTGHYTLWIPDAQSGSVLQVMQTNVDHYVSTGGDPGTTGGAYDRPADAITFTAASGMVYTGVNFGDVPPNSFNTDGEQNTTAGTTVFFPHNFKARTDGEVSFSTTKVANPESPGWIQTIYRDKNCNGKIDDNDSLIDEAIALTTGEKVCLIVRANTPSGVPEGASNTITVTADFNYTNATPALSRSYARTDLVNITGASGSGLKISKQVDQAQALPGETLTYTISYVHNGSQPLHDLKIKDSTPAYTGFVSASCNAPLPDNLTGCSITKPAAGEEGAVIWTFSGTLAPGSSGTVTYQVSIKE